MNVELSIILPCLNESATVGICVRKAHEYLLRAGIRGEVIVADNGSTDDSTALARVAGARIVHINEKGYGAALRGGILVARGRFVIIGDADDSYDFSELDPFVEKLRSGSDLVVGNRFRGGIERGAMPFLHRYLGNPVLSFIGRLFFEANIGDFHCGLRAFNREAILRLKLSASGMEFASEMIAKAALAGIRIVEVPTKLYKDGRGRAPHLRTWRDGWRHLRFLLMLSPRWLFLYPGLLLLAVGGVLQALLMPGALRFGTIGLDIHTMLYAAAMSIIGVQMVWFAVFAKVHGTSAGTLPQDYRFERALTVLTLERGLALGMVLLAGGVTTSAIAVKTWAMLEFGQLDPREIMRVAIPSVSMMIIGIEFIFASFLLSVLRVRSQDATALAYDSSALESSEKSSPVYPVSL